MLKRPKQEKEFPGDEDDYDEDGYDDETSGQRLRSNARQSVNWLIEAFEEAERELAMFRKICCFKKRLTPAGKAAASYAVNNEGTVGIRRKDIARLLQISESALSRYVEEE